MSTRDLRLVPSGHMADTLVGRAEHQAREGVPPFKTFHTGMPSLDAIPSWWGVTTVLGPDGIANRALAIRIALEAAKTGENVLWLCMVGASEGAALRMVAGAVGIQIGRVFVNRDLTKPEWNALRRSAARFSRLPIQFADAHGANINEIRAACSNASKRASGGNGPLDLVVIDNAEVLGRPTISEFEHLSEDIRTPFLVVATDCAKESGRPPSVNLRLPLRRESLVLDLCPSPLPRNRKAGWLDWRPKRHLGLVIRRVGRGHATAVDVLLLTDSHLLAEASPVAR